MSANHHLKPCKNGYFSNAPVTKQVGNYKLYYIYPILCAGRQRFIPMPSIPWEEAHQAYPVCLACHLLLLSEIQAVTTATPCQTQTQGIGKENGRLQIISTEVFAYRTASIHRTTNTLPRSFHSQRQGGADQFVTKGHHHQHQVSFYKIFKVCNPNR